MWSWNKPYTAPFDVVLECAPLFHGPGGYSVCQCYGSNGNKHSLITAKT